MSLLTKLFGSPRQSAFSFLFPILLVLLIIGTMSSCGKDAWIKESPATQGSEDEEDEATPSVAAPSAPANPPVPHEDEEEEAGLSDYWHQVLQNLRVFPR